MTQWDPQTQIPTPPIEALFPTAVGANFALLYAGLAAVVLVYALRHIRELKGKVIILFMIGGLINAINEPILDVITACWHPELNQPTAYTLFGRDMPFWVPAVYMFYFGGLAGLNYIAFSRKLSRGVIWFWFFVPVMLDILIEEVMLFFDLYYYYGNQPLILINKFPLWYCFTNSLAESTAVAAVVLLMPYLKGLRLLYIALIPPATMAIVYSTVALPTIYAINHEGLSPWIAQVCGLITVLLCCWVVYGMTRVLAPEGGARRQADIALSSP